MLSVFDQGPPPPCPAPFNLAAHVLAQASRVPDKVALAVLGPSRAERWSYARLESAVRGTATGLLQAGLVPGDLVLLRLDNTVDFPLAFLGAVAAGIVPVPLSAALTAPEVARLARALSPAAMLHDAGLAAPDTLRRIPLPDLRAMRDLPRAEYAMGDPERLAYVVFTSGTSGTPRAVMHAHRAVWARRMMHEGWYGLTPEDRLMHAGAFNWTYTLGTGLLDPWSLGATALIPASGTDPATLPLLLSRHDATIFAASPGVYRKLLKHWGKTRAPRLRHGLSAGEKLTDGTRADWETATGTAVYEAYGMSECSTFVSAAPGAPAPPGTLGRPQPGRRVAILGPDHTAVPTGETGTIAVARGDPGLMLGYMGAPEATAARMAGEWFLTGDLGAMDESGAIAYHGRADDLMNAGGVRVSPAEVEAALGAFPGIEALAVTDVALKDQVRVIACFYTAPEPLDQEALSAFAAERLARWKQPRLWIRTAVLPTGPNGKLSRRRLRETWDETIAEAANGQA
ncbi:MAG: class I adenylate-forming enzyme family protein [Rhodosalinus sp.]